MSLEERILVPELMDAPGLDPKAHGHALRGLQRVNLISRTASKIASQIATLAHSRSLTTVSVLDLGCGSGDVATQVAQKLATRFPCNATGWDISPFAIETAQEYARSYSKKLNTNVPIQFEAADALSDEPRSRSNSRRFDFVYCALFLHHFTEEQAVRLLLQMKTLAIHGIVVDDLLRSRLGLWMAKVGVQLLSRSPIVHFDGPQSVRAAFTVSEMESLASRAGLTPYAIQQHWPARFMFVWESPR